MRRIKTFKQFRDNEVLTEEFLGLDKIWRDMTGATKQRVQSAVNYVEFVFLLFKQTLELNSQDDNFKIEKLSPIFIEKYKETIEDNFRIKIPGTEAYKSFFITCLDDTLKFYNDKSKIKEVIKDKVSFLRELSTKEFEKFDTLKNFLIDRLSVSRITEDVISQAREKLFENLKKKFDDISDKIKSLKNELNQSEMLNFYSEVDFDYRSYNQEISSKIVAQFTKSLILRLKKHKEKIDISAYSHYSIDDGSRYSYDDEYGADYIKLIDKNVYERKLSDLENYKKIMDEFFSFEEKFKKVNTEVDEFVAELERYSNKKVYNRQISGILLFDLIREINKNISPYKDLVSTFNKINKDFSELTVREILRKGDEEFKTIPLVVITDNKDVLTDNQQISQNVVYHGSIHNDLTINIMDDFINKKPPKFKLQFGGYGMFCSTDISAACQWAWFRSVFGKIAHGSIPEEIVKQFSIKGSPYFPTLYKVTLKEGTKFKFKRDDNTCSYEEMESYLGAGLAGHHSGSTVVDTGHGKGASQELVIVDKNAIQKLEKFTLQDFENIRDWNIVPFNEWNPKYGVCTKEIFINWYQEMIKKRGGQD